ncbi:uncharacterized protein CEXT_332891 [Caerostris extrusa]|uniref:Uncharacterized protein n=1 Tax=Caerostris extrusa TaxID=172846 RepID=A0AAV4PL95_CAEEX|nr:uncharacterized protein CEXT_332891 [Caerostris extrusa]
MDLYLKKQLAVLFCFCIVSTVFAEDTNRAFKDSAKIGLSGYSGKLDNWRSYNWDYKNKISDTSSSISRDSDDGLKYDTSTDLDDFIPDRSTSDKYSYSPGGFYIPQEKKAKMNYFVEEVSVNDNSEDKTSTANHESPKDLATKKVLTGSQTETQVITRPSLLSQIAKVFKNPMVILSVAFVPLAFIAEMLFPYFLKMFDNRMMPAVASTFASGFARSLDGDISLHVEQVLDAVNEFGVRAVEDPRCFKRFLCQGAKSHFDNHVDESSLVQKVISKVEKSVDDDLLDRWGLKQLLNSVQNGNCDSLSCTGSPAYTQDVPLLEKIYLIGSKFFNSTKIVHSSEN